jgi:hypothetical protein
MGGTTVNEIDNKYTKFNSLILDNDKYYVGNMVGCHERGNWVDLGVL